MCFSTEADLVAGAALVLVALTMADSLASTWCVFAAVSSVLVLVHLTHRAHRAHRADAHDGSSPTEKVPA